MIELQAHLANELLSRRETEAIFLAAKGNSTKSAASLMHVSPCTVKEFQDSARTKLNAKNIAHAVSLAWENGILSGTQSD